MPHDANGNLLKVNDRVLIEGHVKEIYECENYCNCVVELLHRMPPDMTATAISSINTQQLVRDNIEDATTQQDPIYESCRIGTIPSCEGVAARIRAYRAKEMANDLSRPEDRILGNNAFMAQPDPPEDSVSLDEVAAAQAGKAEQGSCKPNPWWKENSFLLLLLIAMMSIGAYFLANNKTSPWNQPDTSPAAWTGERFIRDIEAMTKAADWAKKQGLPLLRVECTDYRCFVYTPSVRYSIDCLNDCNIYGMAVR